MDTQTIGEALRFGSARLRDLGLQSADLEASLLLCQVTGLGRLDLVSRTGAALATSQQDAYRDLLARRVRREPLQYLTGRQEFMSLQFQVTPAVLVPRPETEHLVELILDLEEEAGSPEGSSGRLVVDIGTGCGAIAISLASYVTTLRAVATDVSPEALAVATENAGRLGVAHRLEFRRGAGLAAVQDLAGRINYLVSNPPYIPTPEIPALDPEVRDWEPRLALDGGPDGLALIRELVRGAPLLEIGGYLALEVMHGQAPTVMDLLAQDGAWEQIRAIEDYGGNQRVVVARRKA